MTTRDPELEFRTAHNVLKPGGYLLVEVPNPTTPYGGLLKSFWLPWLQPEHQHFLNQANFERLLGRTGFEIVEWRWQDAHVQTFALSALLALYRYAPPASPWLRLSLLARVRRAFIWGTGLAVVLPAVLLDKTLGNFLPKPHWTTNYGVLARALPVESVPDSQGAVAEPALVGAATGNGAR